MKRYPTARLIPLITFCSILCVSVQPVALAQDSDTPKDPAPGINSSLFSSLRWRGIGPSLMSGRVGDLLVDHGDYSTWYIAASSGGVWKSSNAGTTWNPIFDGQGSYSIGCLAMNPRNRFEIFVGTGENNSQRSVGYGDGLYRSRDGGKSFQHVGLKESEHIAKILYHPKKSGVIYVASQGPLWKSGGQRGVYRSTDGGDTWENILEISEDTGVTDLVMDPRDPNTMYAAAYQRRRHVWTLIDGGPESAIYKTTDGGANWKKLRSGMPSGDLGRIGLAISPIDPDVVYAIVEATRGKSGFYRSPDRGQTWRRMGSYVSSSPQYYQEIIADPHQMDRVYSLDTYLHVTEDGGKTFTRAGEADKHVDNHAMWIDPSDPDHLIIGCDGGLYETFDRCKTYRFTANLPITQFYKIAIDRSEPFYNVYGGTQDNATLGGPSQTDNVNGIRNADWFITVFGDGFGPAVDQTDNNIVYSQWQYGGLIRFDRRTGIQTDIKPQATEDDPPLRWNWDSALALSPHKPGRLYYGSQFLFRSDDRGDSWTKISPDLSRQIDRNKLRVMGRVWSVDAVAKNNSTSFYGTIVAAAESPRVDGLIYVGTDDGLVQVTEDGGESWRKIETFGSLDVPEFAYVSDIEPSKHDDDTVYVVVQNFKRGDFAPYVVKSTDRGKTWTDITGNLPERGSSYTLAEDHVKPELLFVGTEFGVYTTLDGGEKWVKFSSGLPTIAIRDIQIQADENDLVVGTFGRGIYILDDYSPLRQITVESLKSDAEATIFPIPEALMYIQRRPLSGGGKAFQGGGYYVADNPPLGATMTYRIKKSLKTKKQKRQSDESKKSAAGEDTPYPSWDDLKAEDREESPAVYLEIRDADDQLVKRLSGSSGGGIHRTTWDFRHGGTSATRDGSGPLAMPGTYTVTIKRFDGEETNTLAGPVEFQCVALEYPGIDPIDPDVVAEQIAKTRKLQSVMLAAAGYLSDLESRVDTVKAVAGRFDGLPEDFRKDGRALELEIMDLKETMRGDRTASSRSEPGKSGLQGKLRTLVSGVWSNFRGGTATHMRLYDEVAERVPDVLDELESLNERLEELEDALDEAGVPWTTGRKLPNWD